MIKHDAVLTRDKEGKTCLHVAAEQGALQAAKFIIDTAGIKIINERDNKKQTPLHLATLNGHARAIKILMDNGGKSQYLFLNNRIKILIYFKFSRCLSERFNRRLTNRLCYKEESLLLQFHH